MKSVGLKFLFSIIYFLLISHIVHGTVHITEVMYDLPGTDTDREWVEVYNDSTEAVDLTGWKFFDGSNHNLVIPPENGGQGSIVIAGRGVAILASDAATFLSENQSFAGTVIDTVMSLGNTGDTLKLIKNDGSVAFENTYTNSGGQGDGNSLSLKDLVWSAGVPTPGEVGAVASEEVPTPTSQSTQNRSQKQIEILIESLPSSLFSGVPYTFSGRVVDRDGLPITGGWFVWSFGNGEIKTFSRPEILEYIYLYPGTYALTFSYYYASFYPKPVVTKQIEVTVVSPEITFGTVFPDGSVEIRNEGVNDVVVSGWKIKYGAKEFIFPTPTVILSGKSIVVPKSISNLSTPIVKSDLALFSVSDQPIISPTAKMSTSMVLSTTKINKEENSSLGSVLGDSTGVHTQVEASDIIEKSDISKRKSSGNQWDVFFIFLLTVVFCSIFFLKTKGIKKSPLEEEASQFTITEIKEN